MKVSIITVVYNGKNTIEDCLKSVANQTYPLIEHIIIDGGSTDGTLDVIKKYKNKIAKVIGHFPLYFELKNTKPLKIKSKGREKTALPIK